jgi:hypothetical protein
MIVFRLVGAKSHGCSVKIGDQRGECGDRGGSVGISHQAQPN